MSDLYEEAKSWVERLKQGHDGFQTLYPYVKATEEQLRPVLKRLCDEGYLELIWKVHCPSDDCTGVFYVKHKPFPNETLKCPRCNDTFACDESLVAPFYKIVLRTIDVRVKELANKLLSLAKYEFGHWKFSLGPLSPEEKYWFLTRLKDIGGDSGNWTIDEVVAALRRIRDGAFSEQELEADENANELINWLAEAPRGRAAWVDEAIEKFGVSPDGVLGSIADRQRLHRQYVHRQTYEMLERRAELILCQDKDD